MIRLLPPKAVCQALAISPRTLRRMKARGDLPYHTVAGRTRYNQADIEGAIAATKQIDAEATGATVTPAFPPTVTPDLIRGPASNDIPDFESIRRKASA